MLISENGYVIVRIESIPTFDTDQTFPHTLSDRTEYNPIQSVTKFGYNEYGEFFYGNFCKSSATLGCFPDLYRPVFVAESSGALVGVA